LENRGRFRDNIPLIAAQGGWVYGRQAAWLFGLGANRSQEAEQIGEFSPLDGGGGGSGHRAAPAHTAVVVQVSQTAQPQAAESPGPG
jgi:hypothetical protein